MELQTTQYLTKKCNTAYNRIVKFHLHCEKLAFVLEVDKVSDMLLQQLSNSLQALKNKSKLFENLSADQEKELKMLLQRCEITGMVWFSIN